jgi:CTP:molybdopterin cytidylyltransferase MocA
MECLHGLAEDEREGWEVEVGILAAGERDVQASNDSVDGGIGTSLSRAIEASHAECGQCSGCVACSVQVAVLRTC